MSENEWKSQYVATFMATYAAVHYDDACASGLFERLVSNDLLEEAHSFATGAWAAANGEATTMPKGPFYDPIEQICYRLARHLKNPDVLPLATWGRMSCDLLAELRELNPARYDEAVKRTKTTKTDQPEGG